MSSLSGQVSENTTQSNGALLADVAAWESCVTKVIWVVNHTINGLGPVRPIVVFTSSLELSKFQGLLFRTDPQP